MPKHITLCATLGFLLVLFSPSVSFSQSIPVAVSVTEESGGLFDSRIRSALRNLGDVEIVSWTGNPQFRIYAVVACVPSDSGCQYPNAYVSSLRLSKPLKPGDILWALHSEDTTRGIGDLSLPIDGATDRLVRYERTIREWVANWGRREYQQAIDEWIAQIDAECFEAHRGRVLVWDLITQGYSERANALAAELDQRDYWNCLP